MCVFYKKRLQLFYDTMFCNISHIGHFQPSQYILYIFDYCKCIMACYTSKQAKLILKAKLHSL